MQQLIQQITEQYKISEDDAIGIVNDIASYAEGKTAGLGNSLVNAINGTDESAATEDTATAAPVATTQTAAPVAQAKEEGYFDKAKDFVESHIPAGLTGSLKEKGEEMLGGVEEKLKGMFS